jgi:putative ABC transport system permease protein
MCGGSRIPACQAVLGERVSSERFGFDQICQPEGMQDRRGQPRRRPEGQPAILVVQQLSSGGQDTANRGVNERGLCEIDDTGGTAELPKEAPAMIARIGPVTNVQDTGTVNGVNAFRSPLIPSIDTNALTVVAASLGLPKAVGTTVAQGTYLNTATANEPVAVLGAASAQRLGIDRLFPGERIWVAGQWFYIAGILNPAVLAPSIDSSVLVGYGAAEENLGFDGYPSTVYVRAQNGHVNQVQNLLAVTANPQNPSEVDVAQPSSALVAQADAQGAFDDLFLGLGAVALLVGAVGVANIMVISVLERRSEIGLRRALGATKGHIRIQFLSEAVLLALIGGAAGVSLGVLSTAVYAHVKGWQTVVPTEAWAGGIVAAILIGAVAGLLPALRAARMSPTEALWAV